MRIFGLWGLCFLGRGLTYFQGLGSILGPKYILDDSEAPNPKSFHPTCHLRRELDHLRDQLGVKARDRSFTMMEDHWSVLKGVYWEPQTGNPKNIIGIYLPGS